MKIKKFLEALDNLDEFFQNLIVLAIGIILSVLIFGVIL